MSDQELKDELLKQYKADNFTEWSLSKQESNELTADKLLVVVDDLISTGDLPNYIKKYGNEGVLVTFV